MSGEVPKNYAVVYDVDGEEVEHLLHYGMYATSVDAVVGCWVLVAAPPTKGKAKGEPEAKGKTKEKPKRQQKKKPFYVESEDEEGESDDDE